MGRMTRREFLRFAAETGLGLAGVSFLLEVLGPDFVEAAIYRRKPVPFQRRLSRGRVQCLVCPFYCVLKPGEISQCLTKQNINGRLMTHSWDNPSIISVDPIEKMPLNHFLPGYKTLTLAIGGCNLHCLYCQNWQESQRSPAKQHTVELPKRKALSAMEKEKLKVVAFNYTEPVVFAEWIETIAKAARRKGYRTVLATAAYINPKPLKRLIDVADGFVVTLKGFTEEFYRRVTGATLKPVLNAISQIKKSNKHLELVNLIVPTYNDKEEDIRRMAKWIRDNLGDETVLMFARFVPAYRLRNLPQTPKKTLEKAVKIAGEEGLKFVYIVNLAPHPANDTYCPNCKTPLIKRVGLRILENKIKDGKCPKCGRVIPGVWK